MRRWFLVWAMGGCETVGGDSGAAPAPAPSAGACDYSPLIGAWGPPGAPHQNTLTFHVNCRVSGDDNPGLPPGELTFSSDRTEAGRVTFLEDGAPFWYCDYSLDAAVAPRELTMVCDGESSLLVAQ